MAFLLKYEPRFFKEAVGIPIHDLTRIKTHLEALAQSVRSFSHLPLKEARFRGIYRLRVGDRRVFYFIDWKLEEITILSVKHRSEAYR